MAALSDTDKSRTRWHLGYVAYAGIPENDAADLEQAMNEIPDDWTVLRVVELLDRCDRAWTNSELGNSGFTTKELISGDINRSVIKTSNENARFWRENYLTEVDSLALILWVPNHRRTDSNYRGTRDQGDWIQRLPGIADSCVMTRIWAYEHYC